MTCRLDSGPSSGCPSGSSCRRSIVELARLRIGEAALVALVATSTAHRRPSTKASDRRRPFQPGGEPRPFRAARDDRVDREPGWPWCFRSPGGRPRLAFATGRRGRGLRCKPGAPVWVQGPGAAGIVGEVRGAPTGFRTRTWRARIVPSSTSRGSVDSATPGTIGPPRRPETERGIIAPDLLIGSPARSAHGRSIVTARAGSPTGTLTHLGLGPADHGRTDDPEEFREAEEQPGYRYELARGVLELTRSRRPTGEVVDNFHGDSPTTRRAPRPIRRFGGELNPRA